MQKLKLIYSDLLQGAFSLKELNLLLVFQVNCPGCFLHALPLFTKLYNYERFKGIQFLALSTAFEDFDLNTLENTRLLLEKKQVVGQTKKLLKQFGFSEPPYSIDFPVAMDQKVNRIENMDDAVDHICYINPQFSWWPSFEQKDMRKKVRRYIENMDQFSLTFVLNQFRGTPTFVLFNNEYEILQNLFGKVDLDDVVKIISEYAKIN